MPTNQPQELTQLPDQTFVLTLAISTSDIQTYYHQALVKAAENLEIKGFRKGKAPLDLASKHLDANHLISETLNEAVTAIYAEKIRQHGLKPIVSPQVKLLNPPLTLEKEWRLQITSCQMPHVEIGDYKAKIAKLDKSEDKQTKTSILLDALSADTKLQLPPVLLQAEIENRLSQLVDQTTQAGINVDQYLKSKGLTLDQYQDNLKNQLTKEWTVNLTLDQIASTENIEVAAQEIKETISKYPQQKIDQNMLHYLLRQQKTIDFLLAL